MAKCPFYRRKEKQKIVCEGPYDDCLSLIQTFGSNVNRDKQLEIFCGDRYKNCEIYRMIMESKYE